jgi:peptidoglycan/LPS O-acetylase OafA/YrhL
MPWRRLELMLTYATGRGMTEKAGTAPNHWPLLDFLRATAALRVLFGHTRDAAGFSYTLYVIHVPLMWLILAIFQNIGFSRDKVPPSPVAFMEFGVTIAICLLAAFLVSLVTEKKTGKSVRHVENVSAPRGSRGER